MTKIPKPKYWVGDVVVISNEETNYNQYQLKIERGEYKKDIKSWMYLSSLSSEIYFGFKESDILYKKDEKIKQET